MKTIQWTSQHSYVLSFSSKYGISTVASPPAPGEIDPSMTYLELLEKHIARLTDERGALSDQVRRNHQSTLNGYLKFVGKTMSSAVGKELTTDFQGRATAFIEPISTISRKTAADKLSILRAWRKTAETTTERVKLRSAAGPSLFHKALRTAMELKGEPIRVVAKAIKSGPQTLRSWMAGAYPFLLGLPTLRRLESYLGLERGYLESKLEYPRRCINVGATKQRDKYAERLKANVADQYTILARELKSSFVEEWRTFLQYKTAEYPTGIKRSDGGKWRALPMEQALWTLRKEPLVHPTPSSVCASAARALDHSRAYFGFLCKEPNSNIAASGLGLPRDEVQSLAMFAIPEFVNAHLEFMKARSGGLVHNGHAVSCGFICSLLDRRFGYLRQQPAFLAKISPYAKGRSWEELCNETYNLCSAWGKAGKGKKSRDPKLPLTNILKLDDSLEPLKRAIQKLDEASAMRAPGGSVQATYKRDALLLALAISNPLRLRTLTIIKYVCQGGDNSDYLTNLYKAEDGRWRLRFFAGDMKNDGGKPEDYDAALPRKLSERLEEYLEVYRPVLILRNPDCPWLFPSLLGDQLKKADEIFRGIAKNYIPEVTRLGPHAVRHIVASDFLKKNPGKFVALAGLLHDALATVLKNYAHGQLENAFNAHEEHLESFFDGI